MKRCLMLSALGLLLLQGQANAQQSLTTSNVVDYDFADFTAAGFAPTPAAGQLDSDEWIATRVLGINLEFGDTSANADFANGASGGGETAGGIWAFSPVDAVCGSGPQTMLGVQPSNMTFSPGTFQLRVQNNTGAVLTEFHLQYAFAWFNDANRSVAHTVQVLQVDADNATTGSVALAALAAETPVDADAVPAWDGQCQTATVDLSSIPIADGDNFVVVFEVDDGSGSGSRDEVAFGEVQVAAMAISDAGPVLGADAGAADASVDDGADAAPGAPDAASGAASDAGGEEPDDGSDSGCGCSSGQGAPPTPLSVLLFAFVAWGLRRRKGNS